MFHPIPMPGAGKHRPERLTLPFLGQFFVIAMVIMLLVLYVAGLGLLR
jgi:hypothetical protein